jgi:hypothetical protein
MISISPTLERRISTGLDLSQNTGPEVGCRWSRKRPGAVLRHGKWQGRIGRGTLLAARWQSRRFEVRPADEGDNEVTLPPQRRPNIVSGCAG